MESQFYMILSSVLLLIDTPFKSKSLKIQTCYLSSYVEYLFQNYQERILIQFSLAGSHH